MRSLTYTECNFVAGGTPPPQAGLTGDAAVDAAFSSLVNTTFKHTVAGALYSAVFGSTEGPSAVAGRIAGSMLRQTPAGLLLSTLY
ncbi:hypothetical protein SAMN02800691_1364 [Luteibacter sp. UNCMF366Tsu5.1]|nr:hypothetical protein SAMN02800691_1364 [Luteibacter sp. UNCMF366Tsu5.1]